MFLNGINWDYLTELRLRFDFTEMLVSTLPNKFNGSLSEALYQAKYGVVISVLSIEYKSIFILQVLRWFDRKPELMSHDVVMYFLCKYDTEIDLNAFVFIIMYIYLILHCMFLLGALATNVTH